MGLLLVSHSAGCSGGKGGEGNLTLTAGKLPLSKDSPSDEKGSENGKQCVFFSQFLSIFVTEARLLLKQQSINYLNTQSSQSKKAKFYYLVSIYK